MMIPMPPAFLRLVIDQGNRPWRLWLPLFLLWPLILLAALILLPIWLLAAVMARQSIWARSPQIFWILMTSLRGTSIRVKQKRQNIKIDIW